MATFSYDVVMEDYGDTSTQKRVDYTELVRKLVDVEEFKACDPPLYDDLIAQGFHRAAFFPSDVAEKLVLDLGAHVGMFTTLAVAHGATSVFSVEMNPDNYYKLVHFTEKMDNVQCRNWGVSDGKTDFLYPREAGSICKGHKDGQPGETSIPAVSFDEVVQASGFLSKSEEAVLKIDIEGSEYDALYCASGNMIRRFKTIFMETHPPVGEPGPARSNAFIKEFLGFFGFKEVFATPIFFFRWDAEGKIIACDKVKDLEIVKLVRT
jgi:FkbM family methyltransferase